MKSRYFLLVVPLLGIIYFLYYKHNLMSWMLSSEQENKPRQIVGEIVSIPVQHYQQVQFNFLVHHPDHLIKLNWRDAPGNLRVGDRWQLTAKLKRIHGLHNPGSFDYEGWALQHGLRATGNVVVNFQFTKLAHYWYVHPIDQVRQVIYEKLKQQLPRSTTAHWLLALIVGERADIPQAQWQVLRHTGTNHLMAIGGLHIGMVTGFAYLLANWSWRRSVKLMLERPAQEAATMFALVVAWCYGALSGFAIPAQRACLMLTVWTVATLSRRKFNAWYVWLLAMMVVFIINPLSLLSESFWLSFGTIALIIYGMSGSRMAPVQQTFYRFWLKHGKVQWVIGFGLLPLSLLFFQEWSLLSFIANAIAIPWLGLFILPFCLLGSFFIFVFPPLGNLLLFVADKNLGWLWGVLEWLSHWHLAKWSQAMPTMFIFTLSLVGILLLIMPTKFPARWLGVIWLMPLVLYKPPLLAAGRAQATMLDVGQGLSVVVQTRHHVLVFDAGPPSQDVVVPFLRKQFIKQLDMLVISHGDNDHSGGANEILQTLTVRDVVTSVPEKFSASLAKLCLAGQHWQWDGVDFRFIYPFQDTLHLGNDSSCVLRISTKYNSMIIPGDIEKFAEAKLLERSWHQLAATVLVAPHHGSSTSSTLGFVNAVYPRYVFYATGYQNRYRFPHKEVVMRYEQLGAEGFDTARVGATTFRL